MTLCRKQGPSIPQATHAHGAERKPPETHNYRCQLLRNEKTTM